MTSKKRNSLDFAEEELNETEDEMKVESGEDVESGEEVEPSYVPQENEKALYHVLLDKPAFDPRTGKKCSKEVTQKFTEAEWNLFAKHYEGLGYTIKMLWNPKDQI